MVLFYQQVFGHNPYRQHVTARDGNINDKAAQVLGVFSAPPRSGFSDGQRAGGAYRRAGAGRGPRGGPRSMVEEEVRIGIWF